MIQSQIYPICKQIKFVMARTANFDGASEERSSLTPTIVHLLFNLTSI